MSADSSSGVHRAPRGVWSRVSAGWSRLVARLPLGLALTAVAAVWAFGAVWSFTEQSAFARAKGFSDPALLPLVLDGLAVAMAGVAFAASLDARPAVGARLGTALAVVASASSNGLWAAERSTGPAGPDLTTVAIGAGIPIAANIAFEVLLGELRRQVQRRRGLPAPVALPSLRLLRLVLAPRSTFREWRDEVLARTATVPALPREGLDGGVDALPEVETRSAAPIPLETGEGQAFDGHDEVATGEPGAADRMASLGLEPATRPALPPARTAAPEDAHGSLAAPPAAAPAPQQNALDESTTPGPPPLNEDTGQNTDNGEEAGEDEDADNDGRAHSDGRVQLLSELLDAGAPVTGAQAAVLLSHTHGTTSGRTGRRLLAEARQTLPSASTDLDDPTPGDDASARTGTEDPRPGAALCLVTRHPSPLPAGELP